MVRPPLYGLEVDRKYIKCDECIIKKRARNEPIRNGYTYQRKPVGYQNRFLGAVSQTDCVEASVTWTGVPQTG